jgi:HK97 family phage major capsid protein
MNYPGKFEVPYYDEETTSINVDYAEEFTAPESSVGGFATVELTGFLADAISLISKKLINNTKFNVVNFVINEMAKSIARWIERELLNGTPDKIDGLSKAKQVVTAGAANAVTIDELIDLQDMIPDIYQNDCIWIMSKKTRSALRKLKDEDGRHLLTNDLTSGFGKSLLGSPVYVSDSMPQMESGKNAIYYGDMSGLTTKFSEDISIEVLREKYAEKHAVGVLGYCEVDGKITDEQKIAVLKMAGVSA